LSKNSSFCNLCRPCYVWWLNDGVNHAGYLCDHWN